MAVGVVGVLALIAGLGVGGYMYYKKKKRGNLPFSIVVLNGIFSVKIIILFYSLFVILLITSFSQQHPNDQRPITWISCET